MRVIYIIANIMVVFYMWIQLNKIVFISMEILKVNIQAICAGGGGASYVNRGGTRCVWRHQYRSRVFTLLRTVVR